MSTISGKNKVEYNFTETEVQGDTFLGVTIQLVINGSNEDLTGATIVARFRSNRTNGNFDKTTDDGDITITDASNGIFQINSFSLALYPTGQYNYAITVTDSDNKVRTRVYGIMTITDEVNRK